MQFLIFNDKKEASKEAYKIFKENLKENSILGLATGGTPTDFYKEIIANYKNDGISFKNITSFNLDEYVGIDYNHPESYHRFMDDNLFNYIDINRKNINVPDASNPNLEEAISIYQSKLDKISVDIQLLGIGSNGHIGFNEPGTSFESTTHVVDLKEETIKANSRFFDGDISQVPKQAVTMGIKDIMKAKLIILLAFGEAKRDVIKYLVDDSTKITEEVPCSILKRHKNVIIIVDKDAYPSCGC